MRLEFILYISHSFSKVAMLPHTGYVFYSQLVQDTPPVSVKNYYLIEIFY